MGKSPKREREREKEAQAGHPHIAHSYLIWLSFPYSTFHDSLYFSPQKQPTVDSVAVYEFRWSESGGRHLAKTLADDNCLSNFTNSSALTYNKAANSGVFFLNKIFQTPA